MNNLDSVFKAAMEALRMLMVSVAMLAISFYFFWVSVKVSGTGHPIWRISPRYVRKRWRYYLKRQTIEFANVIERELGKSIRANRFELNLSPLVSDFALQMLATEHALRICKTKEIAFELSDGFQARSGADLEFDYPCFDGLEIVIVCAVDRPDNDPVEVARLLFHEYITTDASRSNRHACLAIRVVPVRLFMVAVIYLATRRYPTIEARPEDYAKIMLEAANHAAHEYEQRRNADEPNQSQPSK